MAPAGVIVTGPNHALHAILSLLTFWACGGWIWIWLIVALANNKRARPVDAYGNPIVPPGSPYAQESRPSRPPGQALNEVFTGIKGFFTRKDGAPDWVKISIFAVVLVALIVAIGLAGAYGGSGSVEERESTAATTTVGTTTPTKTAESDYSGPWATADPTTVETPAEARPAPTDAQVVEAFESYINERANSGVMLAQSVTSVTAADGVVTVAVDPSPVLLEMSLELWDNNLAEFFGIPVVFNDDEGVWLRKTVHRVDTVDADGNSLGSMTAAELNKKATG